jgi:hypothetical protein
MARENPRITQSRQKSNANHRRRELSIKVGDYVYVKLSPIRGLRHFKIQSKLAPRFFGPIKITDGREEEMKAEFLLFFNDLSESQGRDSY